MIRCNAKKTWTPLIKMSTLFWREKHTKFSILFRWFRHIQEASNAYRTRDPKIRGRYAADPLNGVENSGKTDDHLGLPDVDKKGQPAGRSQSFHESSTSSRELHSERQPSSPPEERGRDSHAKKAGKFRWWFRFFSVLSGYLAFWSHKMDN